MTFRLPGVVLALITAAGAGWAVERETITTDWKGFQQQVSIRKLSRRNVRVTLSGGGEIKTALVAVTESGLVVRSTKATRNRDSGPGQAVIPKEQVKAVRFGGRTGRRGLIGGLAGLGAGVGLPVAVSASRGYEEVPVSLAAVVLGPALGAAGYFIGHMLDKPAPEFVIR